MLEIISRQKFTIGPDSQHVFREVGGYIGRGAECEWILPDKTKKISRKHALISFEQSSFMIEDVSSNGLFHAMGKERLAKGQKYKIEHGATFLIGEYSIQARLLHAPDSYLSVEGMSADDIIPGDEILADDPLIALEQEDEFNARKRLGMYSDLLGRVPTPPAFQADHTEAPLTSMPPVNVVPEDWNDEEELLPDTGKERPPSNLEVVALGDEQPVVRPKDSGVEKEAEYQRTTGQSDSEAELDGFFQALGFQAAPASSEERERVLRVVANLLLASVEGMLQALRNRADSKNELRLPVTTMTLASNNPLKFSPNAKAALEYLLAPSSEGMLPPVQAMLNAFDDLHSHNLGLIAGARAAVQAALGRVSPEAVEAKLEASGVSRFRRKGQLWPQFVNMHSKLCHDRSGFAAFFLEDFARAYELQVRTLYSGIHRSQGER